MLTEFMLPEILKSIICGFKKTTTMKVTYHVLHIMWRYQMHLIIIVKCCLFNASNEKIIRKIKAKMYHEAPRDTPVLS